jgi:2'-5' RNA ligase
LISRAKELILLIEESDFLISEVHNYAVIQLMLPPEQAHQILNLRHLFSEDELDKLESESQDLPPHITIFYGLSNSDLPQLQKELKRFGPLEYKIQPHPKVFKNERHDVLHFPVESEDFRKLHYQIRNLTGKVPPTFKEYRPHCTVLYLKKETPYLHCKLNKSLIGKTNSVTFSDTDDQQHLIELR